MGHHRRCSCCLSYFPASLANCPECAPRRRGPSALSAIVAIVALAGVVWGLQQIWQRSAERARRAGQEEASVPTTPSVPPTREAEDEPADSAVAVVLDDGPRPPSREEMVLGAAVSLESVDSQGRTLQTVRGLRHPTAGILIPLSGLNGAKGLTASAWNGALQESVRSWDRSGFAAIDGRPGDPVAPPLSLSDGAPPAGTGLISRDVERSRWMAFGMVTEGGERWSASTERRDTFVFDDQLHWLGLAVADDCMGAADGRLIPPSALVAQGPKDRADPTPIEHISQFHDTAADWRIDRARLADAHRRWPDAVAEWRRALELDPSWREALLEEAVASAAAWFADETADDRALRDALDGLATSLAPDGRVEVLAARCRLEAGDTEGALERLLRVDGSSLSDSWRSAWEEALRLAFVERLEAARSSGDWADAVGVGEQGLAWFPDDAVLLRSLGYAAVEAGESALGLGWLERLAVVQGQASPRLASLLERLRGAASQPGVVELAYDPSEGGIYLDARFGARVIGRSLVDTGANYTAISERLAGRLGLDLRRPMRTSRVRTANGVVEDRPVVMLEALSLGAASRQNIEAVVLPFDGADGLEALIGMNFLDAYDVGIDAQLGRLRLAPLR